MFMIRRRAPRATTVPGLLFRAWGAAGLLLALTLLAAPPSVHADEPVPAGAPDPAEVSAAGATGATDAGAAASRPGGANPRP